MKLITPEFIKNGHEEYKQTSDKDSEIQLNALLSVKILGKIIL